MRTKSSNFQLCVENICVNIKEKEILKNVSTVSKTGEMLAIMGPTGSGKTTLLNAISGRQEFHSGSITLNGQNFDKRLRRRLAFVQQQDVFFSQLTLRETLQFTAQLRISSKITIAEKESIIEEIVDRLLIRACLDTVIGDDYTKGLSGGEKKRASIACELLVNPDILMLDEPTSGLDSSTAFDIIQCLQFYARDFNKMFIFTIHQPSSLIFHMFSNLLLLTKGQIAYFGSVDKAIPYFKELNLQCGVQCNPADFLLQTITSDEETVNRVIEKGNSTRFIRKSQTSMKITMDDAYIHDGSDSQENTERDKSKTHIPVKADHNNGHAIQIDDFDVMDIDKWPNSWFTQYRVLAGRSIKQAWRVIKQGYTLATTAIVSVLCCLMYIQVGVNLETSRDVYGLNHLRDEEDIFVYFEIYFFGAYLTFIPPFESLSDFQSVRLVINKEGAAGAYRFSALFCALMTSDIPNSVIQPVFMYSVYFWVGGLGGVSQYFSSMPYYILHIFATHGLGLFIAALCPDMRMAVTTLFSYLISSYLLGGFFSQNVPEWLTWIKYLSIFYYPYASTIKIITEQMPPTPCNETSVISYPQCADNSTEYITSDQVLEKANVVLPLYFYVAMIFVYTIGLRIVGYITMRYKRSIPV